MASEDGNLSTHPFGNCAGLVTARGGREEEDGPPPCEFYFYLAHISDITDGPYLVLWAYLGLDQL